MFNKKLITKLNSDIKDKDTRIQQLEDILCPFNKHDYIVISEYVMTNCIGGIIDAWSIRELQCKRCKNIIEDNNIHGYFKIKLEGDE